VEGEIKVREKIAVAVIAILACALFLVPYASADKLKIIDKWVEGPSGEVLDEYTYVDVDGECTYKVKVGIEGNSMRPLYITANLAFGPNHGNRECNDTRTKEGEIGGGETTTTISIEDISLSALADCDDAFKEFVDGKSGWKWDKCWYTFDVESWMVREGAQTEKIKGIPVLTVIDVKFYNSSVEQNRVYKDLSFDYHVKVKANCEDSIELQVRNYTSGRWDIHWLQNYTERDLYTNKTLTWHAVNLTPDNFDSEGHGQYTFVANISKSKPKEPYSGPTIEERFDDCKVSYNKTINELLSFDYEVWVEIDQIKDSIELKVYNYTLRDWEEKGIRNYTKPGEDQKLKWENIILSSDYFDDDLRGKYQLVGKYKTSEIIGPVIEEKFYDLRVTPTEGENNVTFNYSVTVNANINDKIVLQVKNHTTNLWKTKGTRDYTTPNINETLTWQGIKLNSHELNRFNDSMFRFVGICGAESSEKGLPIWPIKPVFRNPSVKLERGLYSENFYYSVDVKAEKTGTVNLSIFCPDGILLYETKLGYNKAPEWQTLNWTVQNFNGCDVKTGDAGYRFGFWYKRNEIINLTGEKPYIGIAKFENEKVEPELGTYGTLFNYTINVTAADVGDVELLTKCPGGTQWATKNEQPYDTRKITKTLTWSRIELPCDKCGDAEYKFRFIQGDVPSEIYTGPELIEEEFGALIVAPENGTNHTPFNFSIAFNTSKPQNVTLWASYDEGDWELVESKPVVSKRETIIFSNITPRKEFKSIEWKCKGIVSESEITRTNWDIGLVWLNRNVSPKEGWWYDKFNFSVSLSANVPGDVVLMVKEEDSNEWMAVGTEPYTDSPNPQTLTWENERIFNNAYEGSTSYNFTFYWGKIAYADTHSDGPKLFIPLNISILSADVIPNEGVLYNFKDDIFSDNSNKRFNFSITMTAEKPTTVKLVLVDPEGNKHTINDDRKCEYTAEDQSLNCSWTMIELPSVEDVGEWEHTYSYYDTRFGWNMPEEIFKGPDIIAVFNSYTLDPAPPIPYGEVCNVTICMSGIKKMDVTLEAYNLIHNRWVSIGTESYEPAGEKCLRWVIDTFEVPFDKLRLKW
jgi:hypothetical protein